MLCMQAMTAHVLGVSVRLCKYTHVQSLQYVPSLGKYIVQGSVEDWVITMWPMNLSPTCSYEQRHCWARLLSAPKMG